VKKNEHYEIEITDLGKNGEGIGRLDGFAFFVDGGLPGDTVEMRVVKLKKTYGYGKLMRIVNPSPHRVEPRCPVFWRCGGCTLQHLAYSEQLRLKTKQVADALLRIGGIVDAPVLPAIGMDNPYAYRNKAQFPIRNVSGRPAAGFFSARSHTLVPIDDCCTQHPANHTIIQIVQTFMEEFHISCYDEETHTGLVRHLLTRCAFHTNEIMACLVINGSDLPHSDTLAARLAALPGMASIVLNCNTNRTNVILGDECRTIWGRAFITDFIGALRFEISPLSFFQVNPVQTQVLYETALALADVQPTDTVIDLYCGIGTLSLFFARRAGAVVGVEIVQQAIDDANRNAAANGIANATFIAGQAERVMSTLVAEQGIAADVIVLDPPRKGCEPEVLDAIAELRPGKIVYVSCDPATLARDLRMLCEKGYGVRRVQPVDMFPQTGHVETVVLLSKLKSTTSIEVKIDLDEVDLTKSESKATYDEIKAYVLDKYGFKVSQLYIAQVKRKHGVIERENYYTGEGKAKVPQVPEDKEKAIEDALKHFQMI